MATSPEWFPDWAGETAVLVGAGPSAKDVDLEKAKGTARFIAINDSWQLAPWADILYAVDWNWWKKFEGCPDFAGTKVTVEYQATRDWPGIRMLRCPRIGNRFDLTKSDTVGWGGNSGFGALNLAVKFGAKKIILVGYDVTLNHGVHWHGRHPDWMHNPAENNIKVWRKALDGVAPIIANEGITVLNASPVSSLSAYPKMSFEEALKHDPERV